MTLDRGTRDHVKGADGMVSLLNNASIEGVRMKEWKTRYKAIPKSLYPQYLSPFVQERPLAKGSVVAAVSVR